MTNIVNPRPSGPTNARQLNAFEKYIGHRLPRAYREFLLRYNGGHPEPDAFLLRTGRGEKEHIVMCFFPMRKLALGQVEVEDVGELLTWPLHCAWDDLQNDLEKVYKTELDPPLLPIGTDGLSNYISIVLAGEQTGAVVFLDHKTAKAWPLAPSLPAFLDSLRPRQRTGHWNRALQNSLPSLVAIDHDDYHAKHVGRTSDGRQFFLTTLFEPKSGRNAGNEFVALFLFDQLGKLIEAKIDQFGPRSTMDDEKRRAIYEKRLRELGKVTFRRIEVAPFSVRRFGTQFGLIAQPPEAEGEEWAVELHPGNFMAFYRPWDSGDYDT
jgi:SMI1-KNR4 cell-wall